MMQPTHHIIYNTIHALLWLHYLFLILTQETIVAHWSIGLLDSVLSLEILYCSYVLV